MNFGDLGVEVKKLVDDYQQKTKLNQNIESIDDIKRFVEEFPEFRKLSGNVTKHVTLMGELSRVVEQRALLDISEVEQELANNSDRSYHMKRLKEYLVDKPNVSKEDRLKLALLFVLRYEANANDVNAVIDMLHQSGVSQDQLALLSAITQFGGSAVRTGELFGKSIMKTLTRFKKGCKGVTNIYTEHKPLLREILENLSTTQLKESDYPFFHGSATKDAPQDIIVFIIGGATYEEALNVHEFSSSKGIRAILGGTTLHNSATFLRDVGLVKQYSSNRN